MCVHLVGLEMYLIFNVALFDTAHELVQKKNIFLVHRFDIMSSGFLWNNVSGAIIVSYRPHYAE